MARDTINAIMDNENIEIEFIDDKYEGNNVDHNWQCTCNNTFYRTWSKIRDRKALLCPKCVFDITEQKYKDAVESDGEYTYIRSYRKHDILPNGKNVGDKPFIKVKHNFCNNIYQVTATGFINDKRRCGKCCGKLENSFAYHINKVFGLRIELVWDYDKNLIDPYHISYSSHQKVWIRCLNPSTPYHGSYLIAINNFIRSKKNNNEGCPYCHGKNVHKLDSFAQFHINNTDPYFLINYWDYNKNIVNPYEITPFSNKTKVWLICQKKEYHDSYEVKCSHFSRGSIDGKSLCPYCAARPGYVSLKDSFGFKHFDYIQFWSDKNKISPFKVSCNSSNKFIFVCPSCYEEFSRRTSDMLNNKSIECSKCSMTKGETRIRLYLESNDIGFEFCKKFKGLLGVKNGELSYDFYIEKYNLLIEYQGEYHDGTSSQQTEIEFAVQVEHDIRKEKYANENNINLLPIWYWDYDNIEDILTKELNLDKVPVE